MAEYKVLLTVKDRYGNSKEIDGGTLSIDLGNLSKEDVDQIEEKLTMKNYLKKADIEQELNHYATDEEVAGAIKTAETLRYADFKILDDSDEQEGE